MTNTRRMGVRNFGSKRLPRHLRNEEIPKNNFTARTYQVELLDSALRRNTIICMGSSGRIFIAVMLMKEMAQTVRQPLSEGGKRTVFLVNTDDMVEDHKIALQHQTDLTIMSVDRDAEVTDEARSGCIDKSEVLLLTGSNFLDILQRNLLNLHQVNLLIFDECHLVVDSHPYQEIMKLYTSTEKPAQPRILGLTSAILTVKNQKPEELGEIISAVENGLKCVAETSTLVLFERYGVKPREEVIECADYEDTTGLSDQLADILENAIDFLDECNIEVNEELDYRDPRLIPKAALIECHNVLRELGPWCAACLADMLVGQIEKIEKQKEFVALHKKFLKIGATNLRMVSKIFEGHFNLCDYSVDELLKYSSPKVTSLMNCLRKYRPETDFVIISEDLENESSSKKDNGEEDDVGSDMGIDSDMSDSDFSDEESDSGNKSESARQVHVAIKKVSDDKKSADPFALDEDKYLCGLVFVDDQHKAYALNKFIEEVCAWDDGLCFVKSMHLTGRIEKQKKLYKKQEEILRKFRMQELNLLVSTNVLEEGVDIPKCNFVCRFDVPKSYKSYSFSKGRARARDAAFVILIEEEHFDEFRAELKTYREIEQVLIGRCKDESMDEESVTDRPDIEETQVKPYVIKTEEESLSVTLDSAIMLVNRYCAKLPSDAFTHLTSTCKITEVQNGKDTLYRATLRLPINSPIKQDIEGVAMHSKLKAKQAVALKMCEVLHKAGELDDNLMPVGKEMFQVEDEEEVVDEEEDLQGEARPGTTKRKQYYCKKVASALFNSGPSSNMKCKLYVINMTLTGAITDEQNTRGRRIYAPEETPRGFGILTPNSIPLVPLFPVFTRSGEVTVSVELKISDITLEADQLSKLQTFHRFLFSNVLRLEKDPMIYQPLDASLGYLLVPLNRQENNDTTIDWDFTEKVVASQTNTKTADDNFTFKQEEFEDAVVMPSYRNMDQPQYFYVAEIRHDLNPQSPFPSPELYKTFAEYYTTKYGLKITNVEQPLLDVDHTSARLNLLIPRYMNQKGVPLPTSSAETKKARRENLQQKQILVPELCDIHVFPASLWRKAVCLPAILYRMNYLLLAEEIRKNVAIETKIGIADLNDNYRFPRLDFGFDTNPENLKPREDNKGETDDDEDDIGGTKQEKKHGDGEKKEDGEQDLLERKAEIDKETSCEVTNDELISNKDLTVSGEVILADEEKVNNMIPAKTESADDENVTDMHAENNETSGKQQTIEEVKKETTDIEGAIKTSGYNELQRNCDKSNDHNISGSNPSAMSDTSNDASAIPKDEFQFIFHNNLHDPTNGFMDDNYKDDCDKYRENAENLHTFPDRGWDEDIDNIDGVKAQEKCAVCSVLSAEVGIDNLTVTNCPECNKLHNEKVLTKEQNLSCNTSETEASGVKSNEKHESVLNINNGGLNDTESEINELDEEDKSDSSKKPKCFSHKNGIVSRNICGTEALNEKSEMEKHEYESEIENEAENCKIVENELIIPTENIDDTKKDDHSELFKNLSNETSMNNLRDTHIAEDELINETEKQSKDVFDKIDQFDAVDTKLQKKSQKRLEDYEFPQPLIYLDEDVDMSTFVGPSPCIILQALTMSNANDFFSLERLETIGDSFLKYAITVYLYCSYPGIHEGKLSYLRSKQVSNYNLYRLGKRKGLAECMISSKFEPYENWLPPGYIVNEDRRKGPVPKVSVSTLSARSSLIFGNGLVNQSELSSDTDSKITINDETQKVNESKEKNMAIETTIEHRIAGLNGTNILENVEMQNFIHDMEEADQIQEDEENEADSKQVVEKNMVPYCLQIHHCLPDKSIADSVEALIGCYLTSCDKMAALRFMSWMGLKVLPVKDKFTKKDTNREYEKLPCPPSPLLSQYPGAPAVLEQLLDGYEGFERKIGYTFKDRSYLLQAFTHASYHYNTVTDCYQRLEFLGDAVLDYVITRHLYEDSDKYTPGVLTDLRSALVNNNIFAALAVKWDFHKYFKAISPSLFYVIEKFVARQKDKEDEIDIEDEETDNDQDKEHVELEVPKTLGDIFESVAGAIYLDSGMSLDAVWFVYYRIMKTQIDKYLKDIPKSPVRELLEQEPETAKFDKPERTMDGKIRVTVNVVGKGVFTGVGRNYRIAKSAAAKKALRCIKTLEQQGLI